LDTLLYQALLEKFQETFGYKYQDDKTNPPDKAGVLFAGRADFNAKDHNDATVNATVQRFMRSDDFIP
jgi:hypothetical protein